MSPFGFSVEDGGQLELVAAFGDKKIIVTGVQAAPAVLSAAMKPLQRKGRKPPRR